jgi:hypothetical protein
MRATRSHWNMQILAQVSREWRAKLKCCSVTLSLMLCRRSIECKLGRKSAGFLVCLNARLYKENVSDFYLSFEEKSLHSFSVNRFLMHLIYLRAYCSPSTRQFIINLFFTLRDSHLCLRYLRCSELTFRISPRALELLRTEPWICHFEIAGVVFDSKHN